MKTLIAVSDKVFCMKLKTELSNVCSVVDSVTSALEAHHLLNRNNYDFVMIDSELPDMDGQSIAQRIIKDDDNLKIVLITTNTSSRGCFELKHSSLIQCTLANCQQGIVKFLKQNNILKN